MAPKTPFLRLLEMAPQLFSEQFSKARWFFVPLCGNEHWLLCAVDLKNKELNMYSSCNSDANDHYLEPHLKTIEWLKYFLTWRMGELIYLLFVLIFTLHKNISLDVNT